MAQSNLKLAREVLKRVRNLPQVRAEVLRRAHAAAADAGGESKGYIVTDLTLEEQRAAASVMATGQAHFHNRKHRTLIRALGNAKE